MGAIGHNGGPALPGPSFTQAGHPNGHSMGMSLRDWFAGHALAGFMAGYYANPEAGGYGLSDMADIAYAQADAMLAARDAKEDGGC